MIEGLTFEYAHARIGAGLSHRPGDRLWLQLRAARSVAALLDLVRASPTAPWVSGIPVSGDGDVIEDALRQQLRARIGEVASWAPEPWRSAVLYTRELIALPALMHLRTAEPPPRWIALDPDLARYALADRMQRRVAIAAGPLAALANALDQADDASTWHVQAITARGRDPLHLALRTWLNAWQENWPAISLDAAAGLRRVVRAVELHVGRFGSLQPEDTAPARQTLAATLVTLIHRFAAQPAELFAYLAVFALDLERLRAEFMRCARSVQAAA
jgi:hypothetical protein